MPITVTVRPGQVVEFPDDASQQEIETILRKDFPLTGEEVAEGIDSDPHFVPTFSEYQAFEKHNEDNPRGVDFSSALISYGEELAGLAKNAIKSIKEDPGFLMTHRMDEQADTAAEAMGQGTVKMWQWLAHSTDPDSILFNLKSKFTKAKTPRDRYNQFLDARAFGLTVMELDRGARALVPNERRVNQEVAALGSEFLDPTVALPGLGVGKLVARTGLAKAAKFGVKPTIGGPLQKLGKGTATTLRAASDGAGRFVDAASDAAGVDLKGVIPFADKAGSTLPALADATDAVADSLGRKPGRSGLLSNVADDARSPKPLKLAAQAGRAVGGGPALDIGRNAALGGAEGALIGGGMGFLNNRDGWGGAGAGFGGGSMGGLANRAVAGYTGKDARMKLQNDLEHYRANLPTEVVDSITQMGRGDLKKEVGMYDLHTLAEQNGDVAVRYLDNKDFVEFQEGYFGTTAKTSGVTYVTPEGRPTIVINKGAPDSQIAHELIGHAFARFEDLNNEVVTLRDEVIAHAGQDKILKQIERYADRLGPEWKARNRWHQMPEGDKINMGAEELAAQYAQDVLTNKARPLPSYTAPWRALWEKRVLSGAGTRLDRAITALNRMGVPISVAKPITTSTAPGPSANPRIHAAVSNLIRARRKIHKRMDVLNDRLNSMVINNATLHKYPEMASEMHELGLAQKKLAGNRFRKSTPAEIKAADEKIAGEVVRILENQPGQEPGTVRGYEKEDGTRSYEGGRFSVDQIDGINRSPSLPDRVKVAVNLVNEALASGNAIDMDYYGATKQSKYSSKIKRTTRTIMPINLEVSRAGNFIVNAIDITALGNKLDTMLRTKRDRIEKAFGKDNTWDAVMNDFRQYVGNLSKPEGQRQPSVDIFGESKRNILQELFGPRNPRNNADFTKLDERDNVIRTFRPDRITRANSVPGPIPRVTEQVYPLAQENYSLNSPHDLMEVDVKPNGMAVYQSESGYKAMRPKSGGRWRLYGPDGKRIGKTFKGVGEAHSVVLQQAR